MKIILIVLFLFFNKVTLSSTKFNHPMLENYAGNYDGKNNCDISAEVSDNLLILTNKLFDRYGKLCSSAHESIIFECNTDIMECVVIEESRDQCADFKILLLKSGNVVFINKCIGEVQQLYKY